MKLSGMLVIGALTALLYLFLNRDALDATPQPVAHASECGSDCQRGRGWWKERFRTYARKAEKYEACRDIMPVNCNRSVPADCRGLTRRPDGSTIAYSWDKTWPNVCDPLEEALETAQAAWQEAQNELDERAARARIPAGWRY